MIPLAAAPSATPVIFPAALMMAGPAPSFSAWMTVENVVPTEVTPGPL